MIRFAALRGFVAVAALAMLGSGACADTEIQGNVLDEDLTDPDLMLGLARGVNSEFADFYVAVDGQFELESPTDGILNDGTAGTEVARAVGNFTQRPNSDVWSQLQEASWAALFASRRMQEVLGQEEWAKSPLVARMFVYGGHAERMLGESFCELVYNYGPEGGVFLGEPGPYDASRTVPSDSGFTRAITMFTMALEHAEAAVAADVEAPENDPLFEPAALVTSAHAGLAQAYANRGNWTQAVQYARLVPDNFSDIVAHHEEVDGGNAIADWFFENDDLSIYRTPAAQLWPNDPRVALVKCGDWRGSNLDNSPSTPSSSSFNNLSGACGNTAGEYRSESNRYPLWISRKFEDDNADVEVASGAEMRLIEAEAALRAGNLGEFTAQVNRARAARGVGPIDAPTTVGALEYPNAQDDAWSILDRERYLENFLEARRFWDLRRWNHPFLTGSNVLVPRLSSQLPAGGRAKCWPVPQRECTTNSALSCPVLS